VSDLDWVTEQHFGEHRKCDPTSPRAPGTQVYGVDLVAEPYPGTCSGLLLRWFEGEGPDEACDRNAEGCACSDDVDWAAFSECEDGREIYYITFR